MIWKLIVAVLLMGIGAVGGYALSEAKVRVPQGPSVLIVPVDEPKSPLLGPLVPGRNLGCKAVVDTSVYQSALGYQDHFKAEVRNGTDKVALKIADDGRSVQILTANAVANGATAAGEPLQIVTNGPRWIAASRSSGWETSSILIDTENLNVLWVNSGIVLGLFGQSNLMQCH
jgi:hypothetical protein